MEILNKINSPSDLKGLSKKELCTLVSEIRSKIITTVSKNGGHLASNLGIVELTLALHLAFSFPEDSLIFDVGHQAYAHKLITGRRDNFATLRQSGGLSGFTNRGESPYDIMTAGHSGSSLSYAVGIAEANRIAGNNAYTVAVIGDGSFTNGMIYEALNNAASNHLRLIIVLNDNEMSISQNVGSLSRYFTRMRTGKAYFTFKLVMKRGFSAIPLVGKALTSAARRLKDFFKRLLITQNMFESLGLEYFGPVAGDNTDKLCSVLAEAKQVAAENGAVVVHVNTKKGMGYRPAEDSPDLFHSTGPFDPEEILTPVVKRNGAKVQTFTEAFSDYLLRKAEENEKICAVTAAMANGCGLSAFKQHYPTRFFDTGIAEEHAIAFAGGLSARGMVPIVTVYSTFMQRVFDQVWHDVALQGGNVVLVLSHSGVVPGDGITHQGIYDVSLFAPVPGLTIYTPSCCGDLAACLDAALAKDGPSVVRYPKGADTAYPTQDFIEIPAREPHGHSPGRIKRFGNGNGARSRILAVTYGRIAEQVHHAMADYTTETGNPCAMAVLHRVMPLPLNPVDMPELYALCEEAEEILFAEEGIRTGGIGEIFASQIAESFPEKRVRIRAIEDGFLPHDTTARLLAKVGLDSKSLLSWMKSESSEER